MYDVYYTTGGGPWVNAGTDMWVNDFLELVVPHLKVAPKLLIHRTKPKGFEDYKFPIEGFNANGEDVWIIDFISVGGMRNTAIGFRKLKSMLSKEGYSQAFWFRTETSKLGFHDWS